MDRLHYDMDVTQSSEWWTVSDDAAPVPAPYGHLHLRTPILSEAAAPDIPAELGRMILSSYAFMIAGLFLFFAKSIEASMMVVISAGYTAIYLGVPAALLLSEGRSGQRTMADFLSKGLDVSTGHLGGAEAAVQILIIPVAITIAIVAIGTAAAFIL